MPDGRYYTASDDRRWQAMGADNLILTDLNLLLLAKALSNKDLTGDRAVSLQDLIN